jgi:hypothetical protein
MSDDYGWALDLVRVLFSGLGLDSKYGLTSKYSGRCDVSSCSLRHPHRGVLLLTLALSKTCSLA